MKNIFFYSIFCLLIFISCTKKGTLDRNYWTKKEAGTYIVEKIQTLTYLNNTLISDVTINSDNTQFILSKSGGDGTAFPMQIYGSWKPSFLNVLSTSYAWTVENDNKRLTIGHYDPSIGFYADATITIDNMKKKTQVWTYITSGISGNNDNYTHQIITLQKQ